MTVLSWFFTSCNSSQEPAAVFVPQKLSLSQSPPFASDASTSSTTPSSTTTSTSTSTSTSLESNLSLQTLPSVPSLQKTSSAAASSLSITYTCLSSFKPATSLISSLAFSSNLLYAASSNQIYVFDLTTSTHLHSFTSPVTSGSVKSLSFSNDRLFTAHQDGNIRVWKITTTPTNRHQHKLVATLPTLKDRLRRFALPNNYVTVRRHKKRLWIEHLDAVSSLSLNNGLIYSVSWDKSLKIWSSNSLHCLESIKAHEDAVNTVAVSSDGTVYTGSADGRIRVWGNTFGSKQQHSLIATLEKHKSAVNSLALSPDGSVLYSGACDRSILVWEREDSAHYMAVTGALRGHRGAILCLINVSDMLISGSADRTVRIWQRCQVDGGYSCLAVMEGHERPVKSLVAVSGAEEGSVSVCSGSLDGEIKVWEVLFLKPTQPLDPLKEFLNNNTNQGSPSPLILGRPSSLAP